MPELQLLAPLAVVPPLTVVAGGTPPRHPARTVVPAPIDHPYAFDLLAPLRPLRVLQMRRANTRADCDSCALLKARWIVFAHDYPDWPGHWSAVWMVCENCAPPQDLARAWAPWSEGGRIDPLTV